MRNLPSPKIRLISSEGWVILGFLVWYNIKIICSILLDFLNNSTKTLHIDLKKLCYLKIIKAILIILIICLPNALAINLVTDCSYQCSTSDLIVTAKIVFNTGTPSNPIYANCCVAGAIPTIQFTLGNLQSKTVWGV